MSLWHISVKQTIQKVRFFGWIFTICFFLKGVPECLHFSTKHLKSQILQGLLKEPRPHSVKGFALRTHKFQTFSILRESPPCVCCEAWVQAGVLNWAQFSFPTASVGLQLVMLLTTAKNWIARWVSRSSAIDMVVDTKCLWRLLFTLDFVLGENIFFWLL